MFSPRSRYYTIETATHESEGERPVAYVRRRFLPRGERMPVLVEITVTEGERLDLITARTLGDPEQFWRVCDANNTMNPADLVAEAGTSVRVAIPQFEGF
ncbi:MAG TPA: hypothetical protein VNM90_16390 [Haliangium sp.]|nr:hypothetical protein [Haliangium sp.]